MQTRVPAATDMKPTNLTVNTNEAHSHKSFKGRNAWQHVRLHCLYIYYPRSQFFLRVTLKMPLFID